MWSDNETSRDLLNFTNVADTVAEIISQADGEPISVGISGEWGVGKSSMVKLIQKSLSGQGENKYLFIEFNAWLYQGYDDARAALMDMVANKLAEEATENEDLSKKIDRLIGRVNWLRLSKIGLQTAGAMAFGIPPIGIIGDTYQSAKELFAVGATQEELEAASKSTGKLAEAGKGLLKPKEKTSPVKEIQAVRDSFEEILEELGVTLVVLIDDLDRCLPETTISTLEAVRLFLFLQNTAFVIAADDQMIKHAVKRHFKDITDDNERIVTSYFDKLVQVSIRVPPLGTQEIRAYLMLLIIENSSLDNTDKDNFRSRVCEQLGQTWQGKRVDVSFLKSVKDDLQDELVGQLEVAENIATLMSISGAIGGNPRLIKRFMNTLSIRKIIANKHGVPIDDSVLIKMLLFERGSSADTYKELISNVNNHPKGVPVYLKELEVTASKIKQQEGNVKEGGKGKEELSLNGYWNDTFYKDWLTLSPPVADLDLRGVLYVSREHAQTMGADDHLSSTGAEILAALIETPSMASRLREQVNGLAETDKRYILSELLVLAKQEKFWGVPPILDALLVVGQSLDSKMSRLAIFFTLSIHPNQLRSNLMPKIRDQLWAEYFYIHWLGIAEQLKPEVRKAMEAEMKNMRGRK